MKSKIRAQCGLVGACLSETRLVPGDPCPALQSTHPGRLPGLPSVAACPAHLRSVVLCVLPGAPSALLLSTCICQALLCPPQISAEIQLPCGSLPGPLDLASGHLHVPRSSRYSPSLPSSPCAMVLLTLDSLIAVPPTPTPPRQS